MTRRRVIYLVTDGSYSTYRGLIAYDRKEDAEAAVAAGVGDDYHEVQVLAPGELPQKVTTYQAGVNTRTFETYHLARDGWDFEQHPDFQDWSQIPGRSPYHGTDKARVLKAAQDLAARLRAEQEGVA